MKYNVGCKVVMAKHGGSYVNEMEETFSKNPVVEIIRIGERRHACYDIRDCNGHSWAVSEKEILYPVEMKVLFI